MSEWINVKDRMPELGKLIGGYQYSNPVLVWDGQDVELACLWRRERDDSLRFNTDDGDVVEATYWQPLPPPPSTP